MAIVKFDDMCYCRVTIDRPYIEKITTMLDIKRKLGDISETDQLLATILYHVNTFQNLWVDRDGVLR